MHIFMFIDVKVCTPCKHTDKVYQCKLSNASYNNNGKMNQNSTMTMTHCLLYRRRLHMLTKMHGYEKS